MLGREFDHATYGPVTAEELIDFAKSLGETQPEYTQPGPNLVGHPTYCVRMRGSRFYPESLPKQINVRSGFDAGKDLEIGMPVRPGDTIDVRATLHEVYEKTGRTGSMYFVVIRFTITNQRGELLARVDNRFMHR
jgi:MaoC dehydratase-like protein